MKYLIFLLFLLGCAPIKYVPIHTKEETKVEVHDTIVKYKLIEYRDSVFVKDTTSFLKNPYAESRATFSSGFLSHTLKITPDTILLKVKFPTITKKISSEVPLVVEKSLSLWQKIKLKLGGYIIFAFLLMIFVLGFKNFL